MYCAKKAELSCEFLPPCLSALNQHILRANYQTKVWRNSLVARPITPSPDSHGWKINEGSLTIIWMDCKPAPDEVLELVTCDCKKNVKLQNVHACSLDFPAQMHAISLDVRTHLITSQFGIII